MHDIEADKVAYKSFVDIAGLRKGTLNLQHCAIVACFVVGLLADQEQWTQDLGAVQAWTIIISDRYDVDLDG
jgi:hypothetical protein